jgi:oligopeptide/dipeptide ABC transporter ATP-binding protein
MGGESSMLDVRGLTVSFHRPARRGGAGARVLRGVSLSVSPSEVLGLVGESGCGKTVTSLSIMGLLAMPPGRVDAGSIIFRGRDLLSLGAEERRKVRGREIAMVFQEPSRYLNPVFTVGEQIAEMLRLHLSMDRAAASARAAELARLVGLTDARKALAAFPHELSGGMKQRAMIAMAVSCGPALLIADEPTTALDVTLQTQIIRLLLALRDTLRMGMLFISHDLRLVRTVADRVSVMYAGRVVETAPREALYGRPLHPYTRMLLQSIPSAGRRGTRLRVIPGRVPDPLEVPEGCSFHPRCPIAAERCRREEPPSVEHERGHAAACHFAGTKWPD